LALLGLITLFNPPPDLIASLGRSVPSAQARKPSHRDVRWVECVSASAGR
jgi:hypothetical protein